MMTQWHQENYEVPKKWWGKRVRSRVINATGKIMVDDIDPPIAAALVAEHNAVITALQYMQAYRPSEPT